MIHGIRIVLSLKTASTAMSVGLSVFTLLAFEEVARVQLNRWFRCHDAHLTLGGRIG